MLSQEDLALRRTGISGTDIHDLLNGRGMLVYLRKKGLADVEETEAMRWGNRLERAVGEEYCERHEPVILFAGQTKAHKSRPWQVGTPDAEVVDAGTMEPLRGLEIKCRSGFNAAEWRGADKVTPIVPPAVEAQCRWYQSLCNLGEWDVAVLFNGARYEERRVMRDLSLEGDLLTVAEDFWRAHIVADVPPSPDGSESWSRYLRHRFGAPKAGLVSATAEDLARMLEWSLLERQRRHTETRIAQIKQMLAMRIGDAGGIDLGSDQVIRRVYRAAYTRKAIPAADIEASSYLRLPRGFGAEEE